MWDNSTVLILMSIGSTVGSLAWWLSAEFKKIRDYILEQNEKTEKLLLEKLEYHERHDDKRFSDIVNSLWEIRLRNAAMEGIMHPRKTIKTKEAIQ